MAWAMKIFCKHNNSFYTCTRSHIKTQRIQKLPDLKYPSESSYKCDNEKNTSNTNNKWYSMMHYEYSNRKLIPHKVYRVQNETEKKIQGTNLKDTLKTNIHLLLERV